MLDDAQLTVTLSGAEVWVEVDGKKPEIAELVATALEERAAGLLSKANEVRRNAGLIAGGD